MWARREAAVANRNMRRFSMEWGFTLVEVLIAMTILATLVVGGIVFFVTLVPDPDVCVGNGDTWVYAVDYQTGLAPTEPVFDLNEDGVINENDKATDSGGTVHNVAAISVGSGQASHPVLHKETLFVTTTGGGLVPLKVNLPDLKVQLGAWKQNF